MITLKRFRRVEAVLREAGYGAIIDWSETIAKPADAEAFAEAAIYVVCNSGFKNSIAKPICERCMVALRAGLSSATEFRHPGKQRAIDRIWAEREDMFAAYQLEPDKLRYLVTLPWVGPVTRFHLEKNLGGDHAKPDVRLVQQSNYRALHYRSDASASRHSTMSNSLSPSGHAFQRQWLAGKGPSSRPFRKRITTSALESIGLSAPRCSRHRMLSTEPSPSQWTKLKSDSLTGPDVVVSGSRRATMVHGYAGRPLFDRCFRARMIEASGLGSQVGVGGYQLSKTPSLSFVAMFLAPT